MKKTTVDCHAEFSIELVLAVPYAYWLYENGLLEKTVSAIDSKPMYYFSPSHQEKYEHRTVDNAEAGLNSLPNNYIHHNKNFSNGQMGILDFSKWSVPPFKKHYKNDTFVFDKPLCVVSNKYAMEWGEPPVNFIDIETLYHLFDYLKEKYTVVYKRPKNTDYVIDQNESFSVGDIQANVDGYGLINDYDLAREMGVLVFRDLLEEHEEMSYNEFQFNLFANCDNYISVQGGNSHICARFGKTNINYIVRGREKTPGFYDGWYKRLNGCETIGVHTYEDLINKTKELY